MISLYNISKVHKLSDEERSAVKNITFTIEEGDFVAITGPSGSGKTTLMDIICMIDRPTFGKYVFQTIDVSLMNENEVNKLRNEKIGIVFQASKLIPEFTVYQNMEIPLMYRGIQPNVRREKVNEVMSYLGIPDLVSLKPGEINRGKQQIIAIGRALLNEPDLIVADEPTGDVDSKTSEEILHIFQKLNAKGKTIIYVTHDIDVARHAKRVICLKDGMVIKDITLAKPINSLEILNNQKGN